MKKAKMTFMRLRGIRSVSFKTHNVYRWEDPCCWFQVWLRGRVGDDYAVPRVHDVVTGYGPITTCG